MYPGRLDTSCVSREDVDIGAVLPHLGGLLTIPPPRDDVLAGFEVFRDDQLVGDHAKGPVPAAPTLVSVIVRCNKFRWHVRCIPTVPWQGVSATILCSLRRHASEASPQSVACAVLHSAVWFCISQKDLFTSPCQCRDRASGSLSSLLCQDTKELLPVCTPETIHITACSFGF